MTKNSLQKRRYRNHLKLELAQQQKEFEIASDDIRSEKREEKERFLWKKEVTSSHHLQVPEAMKEHVEFGKEIILCSLLCAPEAFADKNPDLEAVAAFEVVCV
ncbi:hypothetical protein TNCV_380931 [Trichonephila clavipes]|uniref:Uncharacterized protein n=1 Tax=Trichonephila clavipes TaxID=2585209 RepID=A0A8X6SDT7_TRICX|nr:hypothetical protein TNCV_380931 [Trichonephila clavipes]